MRIFVALSHVGWKAGNRCAKLERRGARQTWGKISSLRKEQIGSRIATVTASDSIGRN
jgi:hypothetical protein